MLLGSEVGPVAGHPLALLKGTRIVSLHGVNVKAVPHERMRLVVLERSDGVVAWESRVEARDGGAHSCRLAGHGEPEAKVATNRHVVVEAEEKFRRGILMERGGRTN